MFESGFLGLRGLGQLGELVVVLAVANRGLELGDPGAPGRPVSATLVFSESRSSLTCGQ